MALAVVQHKSIVAGSGVPGTITLTSAPTVGNLLVAFLFFNISTYPTWSTSWTVLSNDNTNYNNTDHAVAVLYRYVQSGDGATLPAFATAGTTYWAATVYEASGVSGAITSDVLAVEAASATNASTSFTISTVPQSGAPVGALALAGMGAYDGNANITISGAGWTLDEAQNNASDYGSVAGASLPLSGASNNVGLSVTYTLSGTNHPYGYGQVILARATPPALGIRQTYGASNNNTPGSQTLTTPPTPGNLLIAHLGWQNGTVAAPTIGAGWTQYATALNGSDPAVIGLYRYATSGDASGLPALVSSGVALTDWAVSIAELYGVTGTFSSDHARDKTGFAASATSFTTTADTTTQANQIVLTGSFVYQATAPLSTSSAGYTFASNQLNGTYFGAFGFPFQFFASSGSTVQSTVTVGSANPGPTASYIQSIFGAPASYEFSLGEGSFALAGKTVTFTTGGLLSAAHGTFSFAGEAVKFIPSLNFPLGGGTFSLAGKAVTFAVNKLLTAAHGTFALTGEAVTFTRGELLAAAHGTFALVGESITAMPSRTLQAARGTFTFAGQAAHLFPLSHTISAAAGLFGLLGQKAYFELTPPILPPFDWDFSYSFSELNSAYVTVVAYQPNTFLMYVGFSGGSAQLYQPVSFAQMNTLVQTVQNGQNPTRLLGTFSVVN